MHHQPSVTQQSSQGDLFQLQTLPRSSSPLTNPPVRLSKARATPLNGAVHRRVNSLDLDMEQVGDCKGGGSFPAQNGRHIPTKPRSRKSRRRNVGQIEGGPDESKPSSASEDSSAQSSRSTSKEIVLEDGASDDEFPDEETGLTGKERRQRRRRDRKNSQLDARIAGNAGGASYETKTADRTVVRKLVTNAILIGLWYLFSLSISLVSTVTPS